MVEPNAAPLIGYAKAWTPGTSGPVRGEAVMAVLATERDLEANRGKLRGKFVLTAEARPVLAHFTAEGRRFTEQELAERARQPITPPQGRGGAGRGGAPAAAPNFARLRTEFLLSEGIAGMLEPGRGDGGNV